MSIRPEVILYVAVGRYYQNEKRMTRLQERLGPNKRDTAGVFPVAGWAETRIFLNVSIFSGLLKGGPNKGKAIKILMKI